MGVTRSSLSTFFLASSFTPKNATHRLVRVASYCVCAEIVALYCLIVVALSGETVRLREFPFSPAVDDFIR